MTGIKVLVVDDSLFFRNLITDGLKNQLPEGSTVESVKDSVEAEAKLVSFKPDVLLVDAEMPKRNGIDFLNDIRKDYPIPAIIMSGSAMYRDEALKSAAKDFIVKPTFIGLGTNFMRDAADKLTALVSENKDSAESKALANQTAGISSPFANIGLHSHLRANDFSPIRGFSSSSVPRTASVPKKTIDIIAIGSSTGGTEALSVVMKNLRPPMPPVVVVQHIPPTFSKLFAERLDGESALSVKEAEDGELVCKDTVYVAPGAKHMQIVKDGNQCRISCRPGPRVHGCCPAVDILFDSIHRITDDCSKVLAVILTGMGKDGASGMLKLRESGARTLGQDEVTSVVYGMPKAAYEIGAVEKQLPLSAIASSITKIVRGV